MPLPTALLAAATPDYLPWVLVPGDLADLELVPDAAEDLTGTFIEVVARDLAGTQILTSTLTGTWISQAHGSLRAQITAAATAALAGQVAPNDRQAEIGYYRIAIVDAQPTPTQRRTLAHGPLLLRYSPEPA